MTLAPGALLRCEGSIWLFRDEPLFEPPHPAGAFRGKIIHGEVALLLCTTFQHGMILCQAGTGWLPLSSIENHFSIV